MKALKGIYLQAILSPLVTIDPRKWPRVIIGGTVSSLRTTVKLPITIWDEVAALRELKNTGHVSRPNTLTWKYAGNISATIRKKACIGIIYYLL